MATKRATPRPHSFSSSRADSSPLGTAICLLLAFSYGIGTLVARDRLQWPPTQLLTSVYTIAGCLALVGPVLLYRKEGANIGVGELIWLAGGLVIWIFDAAALARGDTRAVAWATPLGVQPMGLTILAVALAGWRCRAGATNWSWTNVTGWALGVFWVAMAATTLLPAKTLGLALR